MDRASVIQYLGSPVLTVSLVDTPAYSQWFAETDAATMGLDAAYFYGDMSTGSSTTLVVNGGEISPPTIVFH